MSSCPLPRGGRSSRGWQVQLWRPKGPKRCCLYLLSSCLGGFIFMVFFSHLSFFWPFFFLFFFLCVSVCFVFSAGLGVGGVFLLALTFHRKLGRGPAVWPPNPGTKEQGMGRNLSYPRYQDCA